MKINKNKIPCESRRLKIGVFCSLLAICIGISCYVSMQVAPVNIAKPVDIGLGTPCTSSVAGNSNPIGDEWPMFHHSLNLTGFTSTTPIQYNGPLWSYSTSTYDSAGMNPIVSAGKVITGFYSSKSNNYTTICFNAINGKQIWSNSSIVYDGAAIAGGLVYIASGAIYCLNFNTGAFVWKYMYGFMGPLIVANGYVYASSEYNYFSCINATTGAQKWFITGDGSPNGNAFLGNCPAFANGKLYIGCGNNTILCLNSTTGATIWLYYTGNSVYSNSAISNGRLYVGCYDNKVYCLNATTGAFIWSYTTGGIVPSSPAIMGTSLYVGSWDGKFYCLNASTGSIIWSYQTGSEISSSPAIACGMVYFGGCDHKFYCLNATSGSLIWYFCENGPILSSPAIAGGRIFVGGGFYDISEPSYYPNVFYCLPMIYIATEPFDEYSTGNLGNQGSWLTPSTSNNSYVYRGATVNSGPGTNKCADLLDNQTSTPGTVESDWSLPGCTGSGSTLPSGWQWMTFCELSVTTTGPRLSTYLKNWFLSKIAWQIQFWENGTCMFNNHPSASITYTANTWYMFKVFFNAGTHKCWIQISGDGTSWWTFNNTNTGYSYIDTTCNPGKLALSTGNVQTGEGKCDNITCSWPVKDYCITLNPTTPASNYPVKINLNSTFPYDSCGANGANIRFFTTTGSSLSYWIETWNQGTSHISTIWVKVPSSGTSQISLLCGDPMLSSQSNGSAVFSFFDNFQDDNNNLNTNLWTLTKGSSYCTQKFTNGNLDISTNTPNNYHALAYLGFTDMTYPDTQTNGVEVGGSNLISSMSSGSSTTTTDSHYLTWNTWDACWFTTSARYYKDGVSIANHTSHVPTSSLPVQMTTRSVYSGPGSHWGVLVKSKTSFQPSSATMGYAVRTSGYFSYDTTGSSNNQAEVQCSWILVRQCSTSEPVANLS